MAAYSAIHKWATKANKKSIQMWLPLRIVEGIDRLCEAHSVVDPITGKKRKIGRAEVVTSLYEDARAPFHKWIDATDVANESTEDYIATLEEHNGGYISDLAEARNEADDAAGKIASQATEIRILTEQLTAAEKALSVREESVSEGISIDAIKDAITKLPESALTPLSIALGKRANKLQGKRG